MPILCTPGTAERVRSLLVCAVGRLGRSAQMWCDTHSTEQTHQARENGAVWNFWLHLALLMSLQPAALPQHTRALRGRPCCSPALAALITVRSREDPAGARPQGERQGLAAEEHASWGRGNKRAILPAAYMGPQLRGLRNWPASRNKAQAARAPLLVERGGEACACSWVLLRLGQLNRLLLRQLEVRVGARRHGPAAHSPGRCCPWSGPSAGA